MAHATDISARKIALVLLSVLPALGSGCGNDFSSGSERGFGSALASRLSEQMSPNTELTTFTSCESIDGDSPRSRCAGVRSAGIEPFFDGRSLVLDFSNTPSDGVVAETGFEGYVLGLTEKSRLPAILDAIIDESESTVTVDAVVIEVDETSVSIDLGGLRYDSTTFVKIDLVFEPA